VYLDAIGTVTPVYTNSITSQVDGLVVAVQYTEGQRLRKGDPLVDIDPRPYRATLCRRKGRWSETRICSPKHRWTWNATVPRGRATPLPNNFWTTRKTSTARRGHRKDDQGTVHMTRFRSNYCPYHAAPSPAAWVYGWWIRQRSAICGKHKPSL